MQQLATYIAALGAIVAVIWAAAALFHDFKDLQRDFEELERKTVELEGRVDHLQGQSRCVEERLVQQRQLRWGIRERSERLVEGLESGKPLPQLLSELWDEQLQAECPGTFDPNSLSCVGERPCADR